MRFSLRIFLLFFLLHAHDYLCAQENYLSWSISTINRISNDDTTGASAEISIHLKNSSTNESLFETNLAATEYFLCTSRNAPAYEALQKCRHLDSISPVDSLHGIFSCVEGLYYFFAKENYPVALNYLNEAALSFNNKASNVFEAKCFAIRGLIFQDLSYTAEAEKNMRIALSFYHDNHLSKREAALLNNLGIVNTETKDSAKASQFLFRALAIRDSLGDIANVGQTYNNLGALMYQFGHYREALDYFQKAFDYRIRGHAPQNGIIESHLNIGKSYYKLGNINEAKKWLELAYGESDDFERLELRRRASFELMSLYYNTNDFKRAYEMQAKYHFAQDSLYGRYQKEKIVRLSVQYGFENQQKQDSLKRAEHEIARANIEHEKEKRTNIILIALGTGLAFAGFFLFTLYRSNQEKKRSNRIISSQRDALNQKQQEITESIHYAQYIQEALLPDQHVLEKYLSDFFILYHPKDIVSGDFFWFTPVEKNSLLLAVADCTGHGVPGAFMSLLGKENLDKVSLQSENPGEILSLLNLAVKYSLKQSAQGNNSAIEIKDGMDIALVKIQKRDQKFVLAYAGANRPLWMLKKNSDELEVVKATKAAIGGFTPDEQKFDETVFEFSAGDTVYLFTDGFADQFGGEKQKKMNTKRLKELILELQLLPMKEQKEKMEKFFADWKGNLEQVDDILVIGLRF